MANNTLPCDELDLTKAKAREAAERMVIVPFTRLYSQDLPQLSYRRRDGEFKVNNHWGQRKLLISEIEFLTKYGDLANLVVYAGAAPGIHIPFLARIFPTHSFILFDPLPFFINQTDRIKIVTGEGGYFTDAVATIFAGMNKPLLFISDIRTGCIEDDDFGAKIYQNMLWQKKWVEIMRPEKSMLKFRLEYGDSGQTEYFDGEIYFQAWAPKTSTETRLVVDKYPKMTTYDNLAYESIMFRFNTITRSQWHDHCIDTIDAKTGAEGIDHCYDCVAEIHILGEYIKKFPTNAMMKDSRVLPTEIVGMSKVISRSLGNRTLYDPPHGVMSNVRYEDKENYLAKKYIDKEDKKYKGKSKTGNLNLPL